MEYADEAYLLDTIKHALFELYTQMDEDSDVRDDVAAVLDDLDSVIDTHQKEQYPSLEG